MTTTRAVDWTKLQAARRYAERGWRVFPLHSVRNGRCTCGVGGCKNAGKHPLTDHGFKDATIDEDQIGAWWVEWPWANVGIATGSGSGLAIVDVDPRNGGAESLADLAGQLPETLTVQTGSGGLHYYYRTDQPLKAHAIATGIDMKAEGGYVVAPPSDHLQGKYSWLNDLAPAPFPRTLQRGTVQANGSIVVAPDQKEWVAELLATDAPEGTRNETLAKLAGYFRNVLPEAVARTLLHQWNTAHCSPPLTPTEVDRTVRGIYQRYSGYGSEPLTIWTARSLLQAEFPPLTWVVRDLLPEGLVFLAGRPKRGKSWLALQIAIDVVNGGASLGPTSRGKVLLLALEDSARRIQGRLSAMKAPLTDDLLIWNQFPRLDDGGYTELCDLIEVHRPVLVVVDTLARVTGRRRDQDKTGEMTDMLAPLQALAFASHCVILLIDHHRKPGVDPTDMIDDIAGSTAKTAVADAILGLYRKSGDPQAVLKLTGRDVEERDISLRWDGLRCRWDVDGDAALNVHEKQVMTLLDTVKEADLNAIATDLGLSTRTASDVINGLLQRGMVTRNYLESQSRGRPRAVFRKE